MNNLSLKKICFALLALIGSLNAEIVECGSTSDVLQIADDKTLVLFNVTDTLYVSSNTVGTYEWRQYVSAMVYGWIQDKAKADRVLTQINRETMLAMPKRLVEETTPQVVAQLHQAHVPTLGFTTKKRSTPWISNFDETVKNHLLKLAIDFSDADYFSLVAADDAKMPYVYAGVIFAEGKSRQDSIREVLKNLSVKVNKVVLLDDTKLNLVLVEESLNADEIQFYGLRYNKTDSLKEFRDMRLGTIQFEQFRNDGSIMSDDEAYRILESNPDRDYDALLRDLIRVYE